MNKPDLFTEQAARFASDMKRELESAEEDIKSVVDFYKRDVSLPLLDMAVRDLESRRRGIKYLLDKIEGRRQ